MLTIAGNVVKYLRYWKTALKNRAFRCSFQREGDGESPSANLFAASLERPRESAAGASRYRSAEMCASTIRVVPRLTSPLSQGRGFYILLRIFLSTAPLASPFGRGVRAKRGRRGETMTKTLSVTCGDSSPGGRAKCPLSRLRRQLSQRCESIVETEKKMTKGARREIVRCEQTDRTLLRDLSSQSG